MVLAEAVIHRFAALVAACGPAHEEASFVALAWLTHAVVVARTQDGPDWCAPPPRLPTVPYVACLNLLLQVRGWYGFCL